MSVHWRSPGEGMGTVDLRRLGDDQIVIHFGGELNSVDAYTFGNALIAVSDTIRAIYHIVDPGQAIEIRIEAVGPGSFRAKLRRRFKGLGSLFGRVSLDIVIGLLSALIYDAVTDDGVRITTTDDAYVIEHGDDQIILPREVYEHLPNVRDNKEVRRNIQKTFETLEDDPAIDNFGITPELDDTAPLIAIPKAEFPLLSRPVRIQDGGDPSRTAKLQARLLIRKVWLERSSKKWSFEWNGVPLSAPIRDEDFLERLDGREILIGAGDVLDAILEVDQNFDEGVGVWENDPHTYRVVKVENHIPRGGGQKSIDT